MRANTKGVAHHLGRNRRSKSGRCIIVQKPEANFFQIRRGERAAEAGGSSDAVLSESFLLGASTLDPDEELFLGSAFKIGGVQDLTFQYRDTVSGALPSVVPTYVTVAGVAGDYNKDGTVNSADYTIWRDHLNQNFQLENEGGVTPGVVNQADYDFWKSRFGATSGAGSTNSATAVPEPALAALLGAVLLGGAMARTRLRQIVENKSGHVADIIRSEQGRHLGRIAISCLA